MQLQRRTAFCFAAAVALLAGGCATAAESTAEPIPVEFRVDNNMPGIGGVSAYLMTESGTRRLLGPIESNQTGAFQRAVNPGATYTLIIGRVGSQDLVSERFRIEPDVAVVIWNVRANQLTFGRR
jgi:hypothetical protein